MRVQFGYKAAIATYLIQRIPVWSKKHSNELWLA